MNRVSEIVLVAVVIAVLSIVAAGFLGDATAGRLNEAGEQLDAEVQP